MGGFIPQDRGSPRCVETHDKVPIIRRVFDNSSSSIYTVKNGFSDLTKVQEGRDRPRKNVMNRHQGKALSNGCREREKARTVVSSREKINNNKNLARATTKSRVRHRTVSNGCVS